MAGTTLIGVTIGTVDVAGLVAMNASNFTPTLNTITTNGSAAAAGLTLISAEIAAQDASLGTIQTQQGTSVTLTGSIQATGSLLSALLIVGNTINATMTTDIALILATAATLAANNATVTGNLTAVRNYNTATMGVNITTVGAEVAAINSAAATLTIASDVVVQYNTTTVTGVGVLNGALLAALNFVGANSVLPP